MSNTQRGSGGAADDTNVAAALARSRIYKALSHAFRYPRAEDFERYRSGEYVEALRDDLAALAQEETAAAEAPLLRPDTVREALAGVPSLEDFESDYVRVFDVGAPKPPCPPYEGFNLANDLPRNRVMISLSEFYKHFGLVMGGDDDRREMPDHLSVELEFMHFLAFKEAQAREDQQDELLDGYLLAQHDFLSHHIARWVQRFADCVADNRPGSFFSAVAQTTAYLVGRDEERLKACVKERGGESEMLPTQSPPGAPAS